MMMVKEGVMVEGREGGIGCKWAVSVCTCVCAQVKEKGGHWNAAFQQFSRPSPLKLNSTRAHCSNTSTTNAAVIASVTAAAATPAATIIVAAAHLDCPCGIVQPAQHCVCRHHPTRGQGKTQGHIALGE